MWDAYAKDPSTVMDWQLRYMNFMFDLEDASHDGTIDGDEFSIVCSSYGVDKNECQEAFKKMSKVCYIDTDNQGERPEWDSNLGPARWKTGASVSSATEPLQ
uniref:EF-hand domain-containing protein n=1 Tax=Anopheles culicifacies TaxID=139723 RepID=A0A182MT55_9DIPT